jgi:hypothetical protein
MLAGLIGCASGGPGSQNQPVGTTAESSPFRVGREPEGYRLVQAGRGGITQTWGDDTAGNDEPVTVLAPAGEGPGSAGEVRVSTFGYEGLQGELAQGSQGYVIGDPQAFELNGRQALYSAPFEYSGIRRPADLVVDAGDGVGIRVASVEASRRELAAVAEQVRVPDDNWEAPVVADPPGNLEVVGSADADVRLSILSWPGPYSDFLPAGERAHSAVWAIPIALGAWRPETGTVVVTTLPGQALDLDATAASLRGLDGRGQKPDITSADVAGRPALVVDLERGQDRVVVSSSPGGDLLLVVAHGATLPGAEELLAVAASVEPATAAEWDQVVVAARGGPGLAPDLGAVELERGKAGDVEWLLQAVDAARWRYRPGPQPDGMTVDSCLKLTTGRICENQSSSTGDTAVWFFNYRVPQFAPPPEGGPFPNFMIVTVTSPAPRARVHLQGAPAVEIPLHPVPGSSLRAGIVMNMVFPVVPVAKCLDLGAPAGTGLIELLDAGGRRLPCPG